MIGRIFLVVAVLASSVLAQSVGRVETSLDYSYLRLRVPNSASPVNLHGIQIGAVGNVNRWLGLGGDFGTYYHCAAGCWGDTSLARNYVFTLLGGPRVRLRPGRAWQPFAQASAGMINVRYSDDLTFTPSPTGIGVENKSKVSHTGLAVAVGGGVDWFKGRAVIRVAQFDVLHYDAGGHSGNTVRFSAGVRLQLARRN